MFCRAARLCGLMLLFAVTSAFAQSSIEGRVADIKGSSAVFAQVELRSGDATITIAKTDAEGRFRFPVVQPGEYRLRATATGFFDNETQLLLRPRQALSLQIAMQARSTVSARVDVQASFADLDPQQTGTSRVLTHDMLQAMPAPLRKDVPTLAQNIAPGAVESHDNFVHVRGNELSLHEFINGVSFLDNAHQHFTPGISPEIFQSVNVITGGFPAEFGNRFGGVLDITTRSGRDVHGHGSLSLGVGTVKNNDASAEYGGSTGKLGYYVFAGGFSSNRFLNPPVSYEIHDFGSGERVAVQLDYQGVHDGLKFLATGGRSEFDLPNTPEQAADGRNSGRNLDSQTAMLNWQHVFSPQTVISSSVYERTVSDHLLPTSDLVTEFGRSARNTQTIGVKSDFSRAWRGHTFKAGVDLNRLRLLETFAYDPRDEGSPLSAMNFAGALLGGQASAYAQDRFSPVKNFTVDAGLRWDQFDLVQTRTQVSPRLGIAYHVAPTGTVLHAAYNRFFTPPPIEYALLTAHLGENLGLAPAQPYRQNYYEVGVTQAIASKATVELSAYRHTGRNSFENTELGYTRLFVPTNFASALARGAEITFTLRQLEHIGISGRLQYAIAQVEFLGPISGGFADEEVPAGEKIRPAFDQRHTATASLYYRSTWRGFWAGTNFRYGSGTLAVIDEVNTALPQHFVADLALGFNLWSKEKQSISVELNGLNLGDNRFQIAKESELTPIQFSPRRVLAARLRWHF
jgi:hypothetical protein